MLSSFFRKLIEDFTEEFKENESHPFARVKGAERIQINNILAAIGITLVTILISHSSAKDPDRLLGLTCVLSELSMAIPLLITSSLLYSKLCYRHHMEYGKWNTAAWFSHTFGYFLVINSITLLLIYNSFVIPGIILISTSIVLVICYSLIDANAHTNAEKRLKRRREKWRKVKVYFFIWFVGLGIPLLWPTIIRIIRCI